MNRPEKWFDRRADCARCGEYDGMYIRGSYHFDTEELVITPIISCEKCGAAASGINPSRFKAVPKEAKP